MSPKAAIDEFRKFRPVRASLVQAGEFLAPIVAANVNRKIMSSFAMTLMVRQHFPQLSTAEIHIVIIAVEKLHRNEVVHKKA